MSQLNQNTAFKAVATASLNGDQVVIKSKDGSASSQIYVKYNAAEPA